MKVCIWDAQMTWKKAEYRGVKWFEYDRDTEDGGEYLDLHFQDGHGERVEISYRDTFCAYQE